MRRYVKVFVKKKFTFTRMTCSTNILMTRSAFDLVSNHNLLRLLAVPNAEAVVWLPLEI